MEVRSAVEDRIRDLEEELRNKRRSRSSSSSDHGASDELVKLRRKLKVMKWLNHASKRNMNP